MEHNMILSASGWRKVFAVSGDEEDTTPDIGETNRSIAALAAYIFAQYIRERTDKKSPVIIMGMDSRPTGPQICDTILRVFTTSKVPVQYVGIASAPEIMAYSRGFDGFVYVSASHNPVGHNGIKFGLNQGGVLHAQDARLLAERFDAACRQPEVCQRAVDMAEQCGEVELEWVYAECLAQKQAASSVYRSFSKEVIAGTNNVTLQNYVFSQIRRAITDKPFSIVADMNGSSRILSIDESFFADCGLGFIPIHNHVGRIAHGIIPEPENMVYCAANMETLHRSGNDNVLLGYMPDCDGDRGNIVYWNEKEDRPCILKAQEVFSLSVLAELSYMLWLENLKESSGSGMGLLSKAMKKNNCDAQLAVSVNCPTSMRVDEIAKAFGAKVFRAEVGEANVVNLARELRAQGYTVRILGEGSNGGTITYPSCVRDPLNTVFALIKLLVLRDDEGRKGMFHLWLDLIGRGAAYRDDFTLADVIETLPVYTTTGVSEERAVLRVKAKDHVQLKRNFQKIFEREWEEKKSDITRSMGIYSWIAVATVGTEEITHISDFGESGTGGLKIIFYNENAGPVAYIWMRGSGTEPVFRVLCDIKGCKPKIEHSLLKWESEMIQKADEL